MAAIIEIDYFNSYWLKRAPTGPLCRDIEANNDDYVVTNNLPTYTWPGPFNYGDAVQNPTLPTAIDEGCVGLEPDSPPILEQAWYVEESRIRGGYNNVQTDLGVKAYLNEENPIQTRRENGLIYSGSFNSSTGYNATNVFSSADTITKLVDPMNGSIQKLYAEDTNLIIFQENKVSRALIDKDAIYSAEGGGSVTSTSLVIGQIVPYVGDYGISKNPESFAVYGFRKYFTDKYRNAVMRLSRDGLTEISNYGMVDWFRDNLEIISDDIQQFTTPIALDIADKQTNNSWLIPSSPLIKPGAKVAYSSSSNSTTIPLSIVNEVEYYFDPVTTNYDLGRVIITLEDDFPLSIVTGDVLVFTVNDKAQILGGWDIYTKQYHVSLQQNSNWISTSLDSYYTLAFDESVLGWTSFFSYKPSLMDSLKNKFFSTNQTEVYQHNFQAPNNRNTFYGVSTLPSVTFVFNPQPDLSKNFLTINYEGSNGWQVESIISDDQEPMSSYGLNPDNVYEPLYDSGPWEVYRDKTSRVLSYYNGVYDSATPPNYGTGAIVPPLKYAGFIPKENLYTANLVSESVPRAGEVIFNNNPLRANKITGIKANYATVTMSTDFITDVNNMKELFAVSTTFAKSGF